MSVHSVERGRVGWFADMQMRERGVLANVATTAALQVVSVLAALGLDALGFSEAAVVIVFVLGVLLTATFTTATRYCLVAAVLSIICFNYFITKLNQICLIYINLFI